MKILLADDSVTAQNMGKKILSEAGHEVVCVSNGAAALKKVSEQEPDLVILDIYMPGYSGLEVCQRLKEASKTADLPVVLTVGKLEPFRKEDAQRVRAEALIVKPFEASELAAAVSRFAEIVSAKPPKIKSGGKLGPQPKAKPQWDEPSEDEFVTTTQKLEEQQATAGGKNSAEIAAAIVEATAEPHRSVTGSEFEVKPEPEASEPAAVARNEVEPARGQEFATQSSTTDKESGPAEFSVQSEAVRPQGEQPQRMAAAAGAGGEVGNLENQPEMSVSSAPDFAMRAPFDTAAAEPAAFEPPTMGEGTSWPDVPGAATGAAPEFSEPSAEPDLSATSAGPTLSTPPVAAGIMPAVDPAFDPDRTQWVTQFPTHFGVKEEAIEESAAAVSEQAESGAGASTPEEIAAILSNLPGGGFGSSPAHAIEAEEKQPDLRPWPVEASDSDTSGWKAEEVPLADQDRAILLAEEMNQAAAAEESQPEVQARAPEPETAPLAMAGITLPAEVADGGPAAGTAQADSPFAAGDGSRMEPNQPEERVEEPARESDAAAAGPDRVAGAMHSAAMAIATRATVSAVASQFRGQAWGESVAMEPSLIEELVDQVLERLKPKLIAEIKRELKATEEK